MSEWNCIDSDCSQYMKCDSPWYEMIETMWLDAATEEEKKSQYVVLVGCISMKSFTKKEIESYLAPYYAGMAMEPIVEEELQAQCILEELLPRDDHVLECFESKEAAVAYVKDYIQKEHRACKYCGEPDIYDDFCVVNDGFDDEFVECTSCHGYSLDDGSTFLCETCGNYFTSNHLLYNSESETAYVCPYCGEPW